MCLSVVAARLLAFRRTPHSCTPLPPTSPPPRPAEVWVRCPGGGGGAEKRGETRLAPRSVGLSSAGLHTTRSAVASPRLSSLPPDGDTRELCLWLLREGCVSGSGPTPTPSSAPFTMKPTCRLIIARGRVPPGARLWDAPGWGSVRHVGCGALCAVQARTTSPEARTETRDNS